MDGAREVRVDVAIHVVHRDLGLRRKYRTRHSPRGSSSEDHLGSGTWRNGEGARRDLGERGVGVGVEGVVRAHQVDRAAFT